MEENTVAVTAAILSHKSKHGEVIPENTPIQMASVTDSTGQIPG